MFRLSSGLIISVPPHFSDVQLQLFHLPAGRSRRPVTFLTLIVVQKPLLLSWDVTSKWKRKKQKERKAEQRRDAAVVNQTAGCFFFYV